MSKRIHVVPHDSGWATRREGASYVESVHDTQAAANEAARVIAIREQGEVIIHRPDGRIRDADSYGNGSLSAEGVNIRRNRVEHIG